MMLGGSVGGFGGLAIVCIVGGCIAAGSVIAALALSADCIAGSFAAISFAADDSDRLRRGCGFASEPCGGISLAPCCAALAALRSCWISN